jgi:small GTP-binding protein
MSQGTGYKVVLVGASGVGKTSILQRLIDNTFQADAPSTVGVEFKPYTLPIEGRDPVRLNIWDTAGQERFRSVSKAYFRNAVGAVLVFAIDDKDSFAQLDQWITDLHQLACPNAVILLVGNKIDRSAERQISEEQANDFAQRHSMEYTESSAQLDQGIRDVFVRLTTKVLEKVKVGDIQEMVPVPTAPPVSRPAAAAQEKGCAC